MTEVRLGDCFIAEQAGELVVASGGLERRLRLRTQARTIAIADRLTGLNYIRKPCQEFSLALAPGAERVHSGHCDFWEVQLHREGDALSAAVHLAGKPAGPGQGMRVTLTYTVWQASPAVLKRVTLSSESGDLSQVQSLAAEDLYLLAPPGARLLAGASLEPLPVPSCARGEAILVATPFGEGQGLLFALKQGGAQTFVETVAGGERLRLGITAPGVAECTVLSAPLYGTPDKMREQLKQGTVTYFP